MKKYFIIIVHFFGIWWLMAGAFSVYSPWWIANSPYAETSLYQAFSSFPVVLTFVMGLCYILYGAGTLIRMTHWIGSSSIITSSIMLVNSAIWFFIAEPKTFFALKELHPESTIILFAIFVVMPISCIIFYLSHIQETKKYFKNPLLGYGKKSQWWDW